MESFRKWLGLNLFVLPIFVVAGIDRITTQVLPETVFLGLGLVGLSSASFADIERLKMRIKKLEVKYATVTTT